MMILFDGISKWDLLDDIDLMIWWMDQISLDDLYEIITEYFHDEDELTTYLFVRVKEYGQDLFGDDHNFTS